MSQRTIILRQVVDWRAAVWAGVIAGIVFLITNLLAAAVVEDNADITFRLIASIVMGREVLLTPPNAGVIITALIIHFVLSILFALLIAIVIHRWGLIIGVVGGAILGLALYVINFYTLNALFPWFYAATGWVMALSHLIYGATAGGVYEALEVEEFIEVSRSKS